MKSATAKVEVEPSARQRLAEAQSALATAIKRAEDADAQASALAERVWRATDAIEACRSAIATAQAESVEHLANPGTPSPAITVKEGRADLESATEFLGDLVKARAIVEKSKEGLADRVRISEMELPTAVDAVLRDSDELRAMFEAACFHRASLRRLLAAMSACGVSAIDMRRTLMGEPSRSSEAENYSQGLWERAVASLKTNPAAHLPSLDATLAIPPAKVAA